MTNSPQPTRIFDLLDILQRLCPDKADVLNIKEEGKWNNISVKDYVEMANLVSYAFLSMGLEKGDKVAIISGNRPEWNIIDMGILQAGLVNVPLYPNISESDYRYILNHAEVKVVFLTGKDLLAKIEHIMAEVPTLQAVYTFKDTEGKNHFSDLLDLGRNNTDPIKLASVKSSIHENDVATIIYTSGTTGIPKGVVLSHKNIISNLLAVYSLFPLDKFSRSLSYLPLSHVYERTNIYIYHYLGVSVYYVDNLAAIAETAREIKPHIISTVPRFLEKVLDRIKDKGRKLSGIKKTIFFWSLKVGMKYDPFFSKGPLYNLQLFMARKLVFSKWREVFGGELRVIVSGGAALQARINRIFNAAGLPVLQGYGLTESSPIIAVNTLAQKGNIIGTVGKPVSCNLVKIAGDGEILCKGTNVMLGYFKDEKLTAEVIDPEGWLHTGDLGEFDPNGHLKITGRKKAIFKTAMGKYISPEHIENTMVESSFFDNVIVIGEHQKFAAAIIVPDFNQLRSWCDEKGIIYTNNEEMIGNPAIRKKIQKEVDHYNTFFGKSEQIIKFELAPDEWTLATGELTPSLKLKRQFILSKYSYLNDKIYGLRE